jgi:hypothetical protein
MCRSRACGVSPGWAPPWAAAARCRATVADHGPAWTPPSPSTASSRAANAWGCAAPSRTLHSHSLHGVRIAGVRRTQKGLHRSGNAGRGSLPVSAHAE